MINMYVMPDGSYLEPTLYNRKNCLKIYNNKKAEMQRKKMHLVSSNFKLAEIKKCSKTKEKQAQKNRNKLHSKISQKDFSKQFFEGLRKLKTGEIKQMILTPVKR